jgi:hypothetical protein
MTDLAGDSGDDIEIELDGEPLRTSSRRTIAAVLLAEGRRSWRSTGRTSAPRGIFCGIGVCFDCVLTVNDEPDVRACQRRVAAGDRVVTT